MPVSELSKGGNHMLIKFTTKTTTSVLMLGEHALPVLLAAGKDFDDGALPARGVFTAEQVPAAVQALKQSMDGAPEVNDELDEDSSSKVHAINKAVGFKQRAYPLYEMLREAQKSHNDVMWEPAETAW